MKFLTGLLRFLKFKRGADEANGENEESVSVNSAEGAERGENAEPAKSAPKPRRLKIIITAASFALLIILGFAAWKIFSPEDITDIAPKNNAPAWVPISVADMALFQAVRGGDVQEVLRRLSEGGNVHAADRLGVTPFKAAIAIGRADMVREFLKTGRGASPEKLNPLLIYAVIQNRPHVVRELVKISLDLDAQDKNGFTPLLYAIDRNHLAVVKELLNAGADANARGRDGSTPLITAVNRGKHDIVAELLKAGANSKIPSPSGETALGLARARKREIIIALLTEAETPSKTIDDMYEEYMKLPPESKGDLST